MFTTKILSRITAIVTVCMLALSGVCRFEIVRELDLAHGEASILRAGTLEPSEVLAALRSA